MGSLQGDEAPHRLRLHLGAECASATCSDGAWSFGFGDQSRSLRSVQSTRRSNQGQREPRRLSALRSANPAAAESGATWARGRAKRRKFVLLSAGRNFSGRPEVLRPARNFSKAHHHHSIWPVAVLGENCPNFRNRAVTVGSGITSLVK